MEVETGDVFPNGKGILRSHLHPGIPVSPNPQPAQLLQFPTWASVAAGVRRHWANVRLPTLRTFVAQILNERVQNKNLPPAFLLGC